MHHEKPNAAFRLAVNGCYLPLRHPWEAKPARLDVSIEASEEPGAALDAKSSWQILKWLGLR